MKNLCIYQTFSLWLVLLVTSLSLSAQTILLDKLGKITEITKIQPLESTEFVEKYMTYFTQPLDRYRPGKGSFSQRVIVSHVGFDRSTAMVTEGYGASYALGINYRKELSKLLSANTIFVEYHYFLESTPTPKGRQYLTAENSAGDLHTVREAFRSVYPGKWIATGISEGGQTVMLYRTFFPEDADISVPYMAPLCYGIGDGRHEPFLKMVSIPEAREKIESFQLEVLKRKPTLLPYFEKYCVGKKYKFRVPVEGIYDYSVLEYSFSIWQWGTPVDQIPAITAPDDELFKHLLATSEPPYFEEEGTDASFFVQAARELGYYGYDICPFKKYLIIKTGENYLKRSMLPEELGNMKLDRTLSRKIIHLPEKSDPRIIFIYRQNDPWMAAGVTWLKGKKNIHVFVQPDGNYLARISTLSRKEKEEAIELIKEWLEE